MEFDDEESEDDLGDNELEEQMNEDEYEDRQAESTAPAAEDPGITLKQYVCVKCGKKVREPARFIAPVHCGAPMKLAGEFEREAHLNRVHTARNACRSVAKPKRKKAKKAARGAAKKKSRR